MTHYRASCQLVAIELQPQCIDRCLQTTTHRLTSIPQAKTKHRTIQSRGVLFDRFNRNLLLIGVLIGSHEHGTKTGSHQCQSASNVSSHNQLLRGENADHHHNKKRERTNTRCYHGYRTWEINWLVMRFCFVDDLC